MTGKTRAEKAPPIYRAEQGRRILASHLSNHYAELIDVDECRRNLEGLAGHAAAGDDHELEEIARELARQLGDGLRPAVAFGEQYGIDTVVAPEHAEELARVEIERDPAAIAAEERAEAQRAEVEAAQRRHEEEHGEPDRGMRGSGSRSEGEQKGPELPPWELATPPAEYLERWPDGRNAELARRHVEAEGS